MQGFIITWDVNSKNATACNHLKRFVFGQTVRVNGTTYRYPGYVERKGVRYLGQSVLFAVAEQLNDIMALLRGHGIDYVISQATLGPILSHNRSSDGPTDTFDDPKRDES